MHGNLRGAPFEVVRADASARGARLVARLDYGARPDLLRAFPFPHVVTIDAQLDRSTLRLTTEIVPTGRAAVPISFCWHPYVRVPDAPRRDWVLRRPACERVLVDGRVIPTGETVAQAAERAPLRSRTFDDHYSLGGDRRFSLAAGDRKVEFRFGPTYPFAQLFVPARGNVAAIEPMTATIDALGRGLAPTVAPGDRFRAWFTITAGD
jgi:galactose mutarotase-like enzyme